MFHLAWEDIMDDGVGLRRRGKGGETFIRVKMMCMRPSCGLEGLQSDR